jgi:hypothetical protein
MEVERGRERGEEGGKDQVKVSRCHTAIMPLEWEANMYGVLVVDM